MAVLGVLLAGMLAMANKRLFVFEDPRIDAVEDLLPHSNCGACGSAGCRNFAEKLVAGEVQAALCSASAPERIQNIADMLGVAAGTVAKKVARLACAGGSHVAFMRARYTGLKSCRAATSVGGGGKECAWGCLGLGDCATVCSFNAITLDRHGLPQVDAAKCTGCGDCADVCPKKLFSVHPVSHQLWLACKNQAPGDLAELACEVACTACGKCVAQAPNTLHLEDNLVVIDFINSSTPAAREAINRCPSGAIVWFEDPNHPVKGAAAKKILRQNGLPGSEAAFGNSR